MIYFLMLIYVHHFKIQPMNNASLGEAFPRSDSVSAAESLEHKLLNSY